jgi:coenzyme F420-0:L-glutamate ligase/coenzyme F420-1:gamma-L-glutamate ligase
VPPPISALAIEGIPELRPGDDLAAPIAAALPADLADGDVVVVAHKVVSKAEGRIRRLGEIAPGARARELATAHDKDARVVQAVLDESAAVLRASRGVLICETRHGFVCANAGIDRSNAADPDELILLPADPDGSARALRAAIAAARGVRPAVVVSDSFGRAWRLGPTDVAIGAAGLDPLDDWRGRNDAYGRELAATAIAVADSIAAAADLVRTKDAGQPVVLVRGLDRFVTPDDGPGATVLRRPAAEDLFR